MKKRKDGLYTKKITIDGKPKFIYGKTVKAVNEKASSYKESLKNNIVLFKTAAEDWKYEHTEQIAYKTWTGYQAHYKRAVEHFGNKDITDIFQSEVTAYINSLAKKNYAQKTIKTALGVLSLIFDYSILKGYLQINPCSLVKIPKNLPKTKRELPLENQLEKVKAGVTCHFGLFAYLLLYTGLRRGEALALTYEDIDFTNMKIKIDKSVYFESNRPRLKSTKTQAGNREVVLLVVLADKLKRGTGYVFNMNGELMTEQSFRRAWERYCRESGVTITPHQLRHAFATILYEAEIDAKSAQKLLGHSDYKTTVDIYTHISEQKEKSVADKLNDWIGK